MAEEADDTVTGEGVEAGTAIQSKKGKKSKKKDKKRKRERCEVVEASTSNMESSEMTKTESKIEAKKKKPKKESSKKKSSSCSDKDIVDDNKTDNRKGERATEPGAEIDDDKEARRQARKQERLEKKKEKEALLNKVPKVDPDGIAYTKLQVKRMTKRVKQGLPPVPTEEEVRERQRNEAQLRREEEEELAGMIFKRDDEEREQEDTNEQSDEEHDNDEGPQEGTEEEAMQDDQHIEESQTENDAENEPAIKKSKRSKPVPPDYVCQACKNRHTSVHWIYDCPDKVTMKGTNQKRKKDRGMHEPDSRKVFVSGLPFDVKPADVQQLFHECGKVASCKLVKFGDTGRCNGQAYVSFDSDEAATKAIKLSGTKIDNTKEDDKKTKKSKGSTPNKRPELKLKISRVLNRRLTKKSKIHSV